MPCDADYEMYGGDDGWVYWWDDYYNGGYEYWVSSDDWWYWCEDFTYNDWE